MLLYFYNGFSVCKNWANRPKGRFFYAMSLLFCRKHWWKSSAFRNKESPLSQCVLVQGDYFQPQARRCQTEKKNVCSNSFSVCKLDSVRKVLCFLTLPFLCCKGLHISAAKHFLNEVLIFRFPNLQIAIDNFLDVRIIRSESRLFKPWDNWSSGTLNRSWLLLFKTAPIWSVRLVSCILNPSICEEISEAPLTFSSKYGTLLLKQRIVADLGDWIPMCEDNFSVFLF